MNKFRSDADRRGRWGDLPFRLDRDVRHEDRAVEDYPREYQEMLKEYHRMMQEDQD